MNPADLTLPTLSPTLATKILPTPQSSAQKDGKVHVPRVDLEPIYTQLKAGLGEHWAAYKTAVNAFVMGNLNQAELAWVLHPILSPTPSLPTPADSTRPSAPTLQLHNTLIVGLLANLYRDPPPTEVAPWVVATDNSASSAKTAGGASAGANDKTEERLKRETMALHARDRRRLKAIGKDGSGTGTGEVKPPDGFKEMQDYHHSLAVKPPSSTDIAPPSGGGLAWTNREFEARRRYAQPLASETLEFPSQNDMQNRIEPICAEEGLAGSTQTALQHCAELVEQATEVYLKEILGKWMAHARSNAEGCIQTAKFRRVARREQVDGERGVLQRSAGGLLPVEVEAQAKRRPMDMEDLRTSLQLHDPFLKRSRFLQEGIGLGRWPEDAGYENGRANGLEKKEVVVNGTVGRNGRAGGEEQGEAEEYWKGGTGAGQAELMGVLEDCFAVG
ncbi:hypothetical protein LTR53_007993 [Teratosphaeriaceae sp. CCFEE 6253]|nr:hypothetical protein LTR53_007993 [Teratosphaeriaceae sp. CCFEE 6253]